MKKLILVIITFLLCFTLVNAEDSSFLVKDVKVVKSSDGVVLNDKSNVNATFNDLNQQIKYEATIENKSDKKLYLNFIEVENSSEKFMEYKLDTKSENKVLEPNSSSKINFYVNTLEVEGAGRNLDDNIKINFMISDKIFNPNTFSNILDLIILLVILGVVTYFVKKNKKVQTMILVIGVSIIGIEFVYANNYIEVPLPGNIKYQSQNNIMSTGTVLNDKSADYTNSKEVWAYYDKVKNIEVKSLINEPSKYYKKFDLTENKTGRVMAYLINNNDKDTPYDLVIMSNGVVIANSDSSFMFSFPNTEKVEGLTNVDFRNATTMQGMFIGNENLKKVEVGAIELSNTVDTSYMFYDCEKIEHGKSDFDLTNVTNTTMMFIPYLYNEVKNNNLDTNIDFLELDINYGGTYLHQPTKDDKYPVYYYRGIVDNNNVKFAGYCWKIVRTTDTGGIKMVYNGNVKDDGSCNNTGDETQLTKMAFHHQDISIGNVGYMQGDIYDYNYFFNRKQHQVVSVKQIKDKQTAFYIADSYEYKDGMYHLNEPKLINTEEEGWKDNYSNYLNKYACATSETSCETLHYIIAVTSTKYAYAELVNGKTIDNTTITLSENIEKTQDGYKLTNPVYVKIKDWMKDYPKYDAYFVCDDLVSETCSKKYVITFLTNTLFSRIEVYDFKYGNDVKYENGQYTLIDTFDSNNYYKDANTIDQRYHYTCYNTSGVCTDVKYIIKGKFNNHITLSNGEKIEDAMKKMNSNQNDSSVKTYIDNWYSSNLINYTDYLEDTIWCNERHIIEGTLKGKDAPESTYIITYDISQRLNQDYNGNRIKLTCSTKDNSFTVSETNGNGKLTYPIALLTGDEQLLSGLGKDSYLTNGKMQITMTPYCNSSLTNSIIFRNGIGKINMFPVNYSGDVRPAISLKHKIKYESGNGTKENPYVIEGIEQ